MEPFITVDIDDCEEQPVLNSISKRIRFGIFIFEEVQKSNYKFSIEDIVVMSLVRSFLEQADGVFIAVDHKSWSSAYITSRTLIEVYSSLSYILEDNSLMKDRALSYFLFHRDEEINMTKNENVNKLLSKYHTDEELKRNKNEWMKIRNKAPFAKVVKRKKEMIDYVRNSTETKKYVQWYSLFNKKDKDIFSISDLLNYLNKSEDNEIKHLYGLLSKEVHGSNAIKNIKTLNQKIYFEDFRIDLPNTSENTFGFISSFVMKITLKLINIYLPEKNNDFMYFFINDMNDKQYNLR